MQAIFYASHLSYLVVRPPDSHRPSPSDYQTLCMSFPLIFPHQDSSPQIPGCLPRTPCRQIHTRTMNCECDVYDHVMCVSPCHRVPPSRVPPHLQIHTRTMNCERDIRFELLARLCPNSTGADIRSVCTEAGMFAIRARRKTVSAGRGI